MTEENKTKLRLEIDKTIQPKQFEPIKIIVDIEETFYWKDKKDRNKKIKEYTDKMTEDFVSTFNHVARTIGEDGRCIGKVVSSDNISAKGKEEISSISEGKFNFD